MTPLINPTRKILTFFPRAFLKLVIVTPEPSGDLLYADAVLLGIRKRRAV
jgi:hypothetical protein